MATLLVTDKAEKVVVRIDEQPDAEYGTLYWAYCRACRNVTTRESFDSREEAIAEAEVHVERRERHVVG